VAGRLADVSDAPTSPSSLKDQAVTALRRAILEFRYSPGQRLVERDLMEDLGVSRTTVREALGELRSEGLVTLTPHRGASVAVPTSQEATDLYEIRFRLEPLIVERFVERASDDHVARLRSASQRFADGVGEGVGTHELLGRRDAIFAVLMEGADSPVLRQVVESIQARLNILRATSMNDPSRVRASVSEWQDLAETTARRDASRATRIYTSHLRKAADIALASLGPNGFRALALPPAP
jgi:DNA-binding GntR family transcriptional regulator